MLEQHLELPHLLLPLRLLLVLLRSDLLLLRAVPVPAASCQLYAMPRAGVDSLLHTLCRADLHSMPNAVVPTALRAMLSTPVSMEAASRVIRPRTHRAIPRGARARRSGQMARRATISLRAGWLIKGVGAAPVALSGKKFLCPACKIGPRSGYY